MATTLAGQLGEPHVEIYQVIDNLRGGAPIRRKPCGRASALKRADGRKLKRALKSGANFAARRMGRALCETHLLAARVMRIVELITGPAEAGLVGYTHPAIWRLVMGFAKSSTHLRAAATRNRA